MSGLAMEVTGAAMCLAATGETCQGFTSVTMGLDTILVLWVLLWMIPQACKLVTDVVSLFGL